MFIKDSEKQQEHLDIDTMQKKAEAQDASAQDLRAKQDFCVAPDGDRPTTDAEAQFGRPLHAFMLIEKLRKLNGLLHFEQSKNYPDQIGIYVVDGISNQGTSHSGLRFICGMEGEESPEFSIRKYKKIRELVPEGADRRATWKERLEFVGEVRGWRTVLARLIREGIINKTAAETEFQTLKGQESANWQQLVN